MFLFIFMCSQGRSSTKIVGGGGKVSEKCLSPWLSDGENFRFEWPKAAQMALKFLYFFRNIFKYVQDFSCSSKQFLQTFFLHGFFFQERVSSNETM